MTLHELSWNGHVLHLRAAAHAVLALQLDGIGLAPLRCDAAGVATLAFPFSPTGHAHFTLCVRRDGTAPCATFGVRLGEAGLRAAQPASPPLPSTADAWVEAGTVLREFGREVVIVVPVYNAAELVRACLDSVLAHTHGAWRLVVIDDASTDAGIAPLLAQYAARGRVTVLRNDSNRGFTATANRGIAEAGEADVVLLNADTEVAPHWLDGLRRAAYAGADTASATAVSDNAGAFSVPDLEAENALPPGWSFQDAARALWQGAGTAYPHLPTGNGFCLYLKRAVLRAVGVLDEAAFPQGYGEENDWCQRAEAAGWRHVVAGNVLVRHARSASFGHERRRALGEQGMAVLRQRWPQYESAVAATLFSFERRALEWRVRRAWAADAAPLPRVLHMDEAPMVDEGSDAWRLCRDGELLRLEQRTATQWRERESIVVDAASHTPASADAALVRALARWLQRYGFDAVRGDAAAFGPRVAALTGALGLRAET